eukprot:6552413-Lingulodinium_polyedra.AAC.1
MDVYAARKTLPHPTSTGFAVRCIRQRGPDGALETVGYRLDPLVWRFRAIGFAPTLAHNMLPLKETRTTPVENV